MNNKTHIIFHIVTVLAIIVLSLFLFRSCNKPMPEPTIEIKTDTIREIKIDTQFVEKPKYKYLTVIDTVYIPRDTILYVEQKTFEDSLSTIWISGTNPNLDSVRYYLPKEYITIENTTTITQIKKQKFGYGLHCGVGVGYGVTFGNPVRLEPYVGVNISFGLNYNF